MLTSADVKQVAKAMGADLVGISSMDRFEGAPPQMDPRYNSALCGGRGCLRACMVHLEERGVDQAVRHALPKAQAVATLI